MHVLVSETENALNIFRGPYDMDVTIFLLIFRAEIKPIHIVTTWSGLPNGSLLSEF